MKTVKDAFDLFKQGLTTLYDKAEVEAISVLAISELTNLSKAKLKAFPDTSLSDEQYFLLDKILKQVATGMPLQYALGHAEFYGLSFEVNSTVLIPRPETEELVQWIMESVGEQDINVMDIGTGSGCIAVTLKHYLKKAKVSAVDISEGALTTAKRNAVNNKVEISLIHADILNPDSLTLTEKLDVIVSNPPYVTESDKAQMHTNVTDFEPHTALFVPEDNPLIFYKAIANFAVENLSKNGLLFFEINESLGKETIEMLNDKSFINIELRQDIRGKDRMIKAQLRG